MTTSSGASESDMRAYLNGSPMESSLVFITFFLPEPPEAVHILKEVRHLKHPTVREESYTMMQMKHWLHKSIVI
jgi:hypothetical protein